MCGIKEPDSGPINRVLWIAYSHIDESFSALSNNRIRVDTR